MSRDDAGPPASLATARVASTIPGRLRLRLPSSAAGRRQLAAAAAELAGDRESLVVHPRPASASLVIEYDPARADQVWSRLRALGLPAAESWDASPTVTDPATRVISAAASLNQQVARRTHGHELRSLIPIGYGMLAARQLLRGTQRIGDAPWYVLAWYASETFQKLQTRKGGIDG